MWAIRRQVRSTSHQVPRVDTPDQNKSIVAGRTAWKGWSLDDPEFEKVFWVLQPQLMRYALAQLDPHGAEDAVSETLLSLLRKSLPNPETDGERRGLRTLAFQVLSGHISNEYRSRRRRQGLSARLAARGEVPGECPGPEQKVSEQSNVDYWLSRLSVPHRQIVLLFNAGFGHDEVASILGCTSAAAAKRRHRALERLRTIVKDQGVAG